MSKDFVQDRLIEIDVTVVNLQKKKNNNVTLGTDPVQCSEAISDFFESTPIPCLVSDKMD